MAPPPLAVHLFSRDLRLEDNTALTAALRSGLPVAPCFIFDPRQIEPHRYRSSPGFHFLLESIIDLDKALRRSGSALSVFVGDPGKIIEELAERHNIRSLYLNRDYTPFARAREKELLAVATRRQIAIHRHADALLFEPEAILKGDGTPYTVFTPFWRRARQFPVRLPITEAVEKHSVRMALSLPEQSGDAPRVVAEIARMVPRIRAPFAVGGRSSALSALERACSLRSYSEKRDIPSLHYTSGLSPHHKFGTISIREVYQRTHAALGAEHPFLRQLYWRDFFTHIAFHFPHVFSGAFHRRYDAIEWRTDPAIRERWVSGQTGFPIVDAGMRELLTTGFMHNRVRMITASFLTKDLHLSWREGEQHFATHLIDYDPAVNNGSWQWAASTGCDAQPYFRIFNPWLQQAKFDPDATYIKRWIPELRDSAPTVLHTLAERPELRIPGYPSPMVDHQEAKVGAEDLFERARAATQRSVS